MHINVTRVSILTGRGADRVTLHTTFPSPTPGITDEPLCLDFRVAKDDGFRYVTKTLGIHPAIVFEIPIDLPPMQFSR